MRNLMFFLLHMTISIFHRIKCFFAVEAKMCITPGTFHMIAMFYHLFIIIFIKWSWTFWTFCKPIGLEMCCFYGFLIYFVFCTCLIFMEWDFAFYAVILKTKSTYTPILISIFWKESRTIRSFAHQILFLLL